MQDPKWNNALVEEIVVHVSFISVLSIWLDMGREGHGKVHANDVMARQANDVRRAAPGAGALFEWALARIAQRDHSERSSGEWVGM